MDKLDLQEIQKHINILNVAYHLCLEIIEGKGTEYKAICPFCGYKYNRKIPTMSLNIKTNKYCCIRCGAGGYSIGLYAKFKGIDTKKAYIELLKRECFSVDKSNIEIMPINKLADIKTRDLIYRDFLSMLKLEDNHRRYLENIGFLNSTIDNQMYRSIPKKHIVRKSIAYAMSMKHDLSGIPGFYQDEDWSWNFSNTKGFFVPIFDEENRIKALSIHLDKPYNGTNDIWFSSNKKINGTSAMNWVNKSNIDDNTKTVVLTDNFILGNLIKGVLNAPVISFNNINNSYLILNELDETNIENIIFTVRPLENQNLDYIINRIFKDLIPLGYNIETKYVREYKDILKDDFLNCYKLQKVA